MIKLVASDLDGTIIGRDNIIFDNNLKAIKDITSNNIDFVICTGKTYPIIKGICSKFNASYGIFGNGNQIVNLKTGEEIYKKLLTENQVLSCIKIAKENNLHVHVYTDKALITEELKYMDLRNYKLLQNELYDNSLEIKIVHNLENYLKLNSINICKLIISSEDSLSEIKNSIVDILDVDITTIKKIGKYKDTLINKEYEYLDISPKGISKNSALLFLENYLNINKNEVMAIGDNLNDLDMVKNSGIGVAVANAYNELKEVAKYTTVNSVEQGGFAEAVYKFIEF